MKSQISCFGQLTFVITLSLCAQVFAQQVSLNFIPDAFSANDMSPDGRYVVGSQLQGGNYLWDSVENEFTTLPEALSAVAVSDDGQTVLGSINNPETPDTSLGSVAAIWTPTTQAWESLGYLPDSLNCPSKSSPYELSADGSAAVGLSWDGCNAFATHWTADTGMVGLENLANGSNRASVVSADGRIVAGFAQGSFSRTPAVWDSTTGQGQLLDPPNGDALGEIHGMNDEGTILLGEYLIDDGTQTSGKATQWTNVNGSWERETIGNGSFRPGWTGTPTDISDDGTIVGFDIFFGTRRAWIKRPGEEIVELNQWLTSNGVTVPVNPNSGAPEILEVAQAISTDGRVIIGHGGIFSLGAWRIEIYSDCDFDQDFTCNVTDIDALTNAIVTNSGDLLLTWMAMAKSPLTTVTNGSHWREAKTWPQVTRICLAMPTWTVPSMHRTSTCGTATNLRRQPHGLVATLMRMGQPTLLISIFGITTNSHRVMSRPSPNRKPLCWLFSQSLATSAFPEKDAAFSDKTNRIYAFVGHRHFENQT